MITKRIIPCLDVKDGRVVKGVNFENLGDVASPVDMAKIYTSSGADELVFYDITASAEGRKLFTEILTDDQLEYSELLEQVNWEQIHEDFNSGLATLQFQSQAILENTKPVVFNVLEPVKYEYVKKLLREYTDLTVLQSLNGKYFAYNKLSCKRTKGVQSVYEITDSMLQSIANKE